VAVACDVLKREQDSDQEETSRSWWFMLLHPIELYDALIESWQTCNFDEVGPALAFLLNALLILVKFFLPEEWRVRIFGDLVNVDD